MRAVLLAVLPLVLFNCSSSPSDVSVGGTDAGADASTGSIDAPIIPDKYAAFAAAFDAERSTLGAPGASVAIVENGQLTFAHGFGAKGPNNTALVDAETLFRIGSMTKALTTVGLLQQVQAGKVDLSKSVTTYLPSLDIQDPMLAGLTVKDCITHQSGLYDFLTISDSSDDSALLSFLDGVRFASNEYFMDPPASMWNYANPNFYIAGGIAETTSGTPYRTLIQNTVLKPLGMTRTFFHPADVITDGDYADGKSLDTNNQPWDVAPTTYDNAWAAPAGYAFSSVLDYAKFAQFLMAGNDSVLSSALLTEMQTSQVDTRELGDIEHYGYALFINDGVFLATDDYHAVKVVTHDGAIPGFSAQFWTIPATGFAIVTLANGDGAYFASSAALAMKSFANVPAATTAPDLSVDPSTLASMVGSYDDVHNVGPINVTNVGGTLTVSMPNLDTAKVPYTPALVPYSPDSFILTVQGQQVQATFIRDSAGNVTFFRTRIFVAARTGQDVIHPQRNGVFDRAEFTRALRTIGPLPFAKR